MLRILRGLGSRALPCGCLIGLYETYANETVAIVDAKGANCNNPLHRVDASLDAHATELPAQPPNTMPTMSR
jgi:hypothetical protein